MKVVKPTAIELVQTDMFKHIELCGRTCYKSEDKITEGSALKFVDMLTKHAHGAMLEHGTVYLTIPVADVMYWVAHEHQPGSHEKWLEYVRKLPYSKEVYLDDYYYITTNYRVIIENDLQDLREKYETACTEFHEKRRTFKITCNRGVSHEFVRHRVFSFAQESQRYCNYSKDKYGNEITFVQPIWQDNGEYMTERTLKAWTRAVDICESTYFDLLIAGLTPQLARGVLPNDTKTELIMTGFETDWDHFFELRCAPDAHPEAKYIADIIRSSF